MRLHNHVMIEEPRGKMLWYPRWFFRLRLGEEYGDREILVGHLEFVLSKPTPDFGFSLEVGTRGSETPFDGHLKIAGTTLYWGIEQGSKLADKITQVWLNRLPNRLGPACLDETCDCPAWNPGASMKRHQGRNGEPYNLRYEGRQLQARTHDGRLWLQLWTPKNDSDRRIAGWRSRTIKLNPLDRWLGDRRYWHEDVESRRVLVDMPEAIYPVEATLQQVICGRPRGRKTRSWGVNVRADECKGIPDRFDHSDGWKGDRVWGFSVALKAHRDDWWVDAKAAIESRILKSRADSGFRTAQPLEDGS